MMRWWCCESGYSDARYRARVVLSDTRRCCPAGPRPRLARGEGGTPLVRSWVVGPRLGLRNLYFKNETANPTWSFKDRYVAVTVNVAGSRGFDRAVVLSTGNLGVSAAAFCGAAGLECLFLAPRETAQPFLGRAALHGARVLVTTGARS